MLTGQYQRSMDSKLRVTLPAVLRRQLGEVVQLIPRKDALYGYTPESFEGFVDGLGLNPRKRDDAETLRLLSSMATTVEVDSAGRVALGKIDESARGHRERLGLDGDLMVIGAGDHFEIWAAERWNERYGESDAVDRLESLIFGG